MIPFTLRDPVFLSIIEYRPFIIKVNSGADSQFTIPTNPQTYNVYLYNMKTSDGQSFTGLTGNKEIIFPAANTDYIIEISGVFPSWYQTTGKVNENLKVLDIMQWGDIKWGLSLSDSFRNCQNLIMSAVDIPNLDITTSLYNAFRDTNINPPSMINWDVSNVTNMEGLFYNTPFNQDIGNWNTSNVTTMRGMFRDTPFNQDIGNWNTSNVTTMREMFYNSPFNQDISDWNTSNVTDMIWMFRLSQFNQDIGGWDVSKVTRMDGMFYGSPFDQDIGGWDVSSVTRMDGMFFDTPFNQDIGGWNVSNVTNMYYMFRKSLFNQDIGGWNVSSVTDMSDMFRESQFNQDISNWNVTNVTAWANFRTGSPLTDPNTPPKFL